MLRDRCRDRHAGHTGHQARLWGDQLRHHERRCKQLGRIGADMGGFDRLTICADGNRGQPDAGTDHHFHAHIGAHIGIGPPRLREGEAGDGQDERQNICDKCADHVQELVAVHPRCK